MSKAVCCRLFLRVHGRVCYLERSAGTLAGRCPFGGILPLCGHVQESFYKRWFAFNRNVNNILIALTARKYGFNPVSYLVGDDAGDEGFGCFREHGISGGYGSLDYMDDVIRIHEMSDPVEKERKLDLLKWEWLENRTFFCYFSVERLFAFLIKLDIIERWTHIDKERGGKVFRSLVEQLKDEVEIPQEFKK